jgi:hypothetical protein
VEVDGRRHAEITGEYQCYASKAELLYPSVYRKRRVNRAATLASDFVSLMVSEIKDEAVKVIRIHSSGDFYSPNYFEKWRSIIDALPSVTFFGYTKSLDVMRITKEFPWHNFHFVYSWGGTHDLESLKYDIPRSYVAIGDDRNGMPIIDTSKDATADYYYILDGVDFAIRLH